MGKEDEVTESTEGTAVLARRIRWVEHRGVRMLSADYSGIEDPGELRALAEHGHEVLRHWEPESVLILARFSGVPYTLENLDILRDIAARNQRYVRARAVVGIPPIASLSISAFARLTGRPLPAFVSVAEAKDWLAEQG